LLALPLDPAGDDEVSKALRYIELRKLAFRATKKRQTKAAKRAARSLADALVRGQRAGLPTPRGWLQVYRRLESEKSGAPKRAEGLPARLALQQAYWLLNDRNRPCHASLNGDWCKLAAILLGQPKATAGLVLQARQLLAHWAAKKDESEPGQI
jgi:hypothetical protein